MTKVAKALAKCATEVIPPLPSWNIEASICLASTRHQHMGNALLPITMPFTRTNVSLSFSDSKIAIL